MRARYYNPNICRFINIDPIRDGFNWYGYCGSNSINSIDPTGNTRVVDDVDLDAKEFGIKSIAYIAISDLTQTYNLATTPIEKRVAHELAEKVRSIARKNPNYANKCIPEKGPNGSKMNATERMLSSEYIYFIPSAIYSYALSMEYATTNYGTYGGGIDNDGDAYRHSLYAAYLYLSTNEEFTSYWLNAHEYGNPNNFQWRITNNDIGNYNYTSTRMDLTNNYKGIEIAKQIEEKNFNVGRAIIKYNNFDVLNIYNASADSLEIAETIKLAVDNGEMVKIVNNVFVKTEVI